MVLAVLPLFLAWRSLPSYFYFCALPAALLLAQANNITKTIADRSAEELNEISWARHSLDMTHIKGAFLCYRRRASIPIPFRGLSVSRDGGPAGHGLMALQEEKTAHEQRYPGEGKRCPEAPGYAVRCAR